MKNEVIFGDNRKVLESTLLAPYKSGIKMVYIDPPYNTQTVKSYNDKISSISWEKNITSVLAQLYCYLQDDGVIFISIDDSEYATLKLACDTVFGKSNFIGTFITRQAQRSNSKFINTVHEYILCYAKNKEKLNRFSIRRMDIPEQRAMIEDLCAQIKTEFRLGIKAAEKKLQSLIEYYCSKYEITWLKNYNCVDGDGNIYFASDLSVPGTPREVNINQIGLRLAPLKTRAWVSDQKFIELYNKRLLVFRSGRPYIKKYLEDAVDSAPSILNFYSRYGTNDLNKLGLRDLFDTPKPVELIKFLIRIANVSKGEYVLDCYAGSGTTGQAVLEVNIEDNNDIGFILIQNKEEISKKNKIYNSCLKYGIQPLVCEITRLRLESAHEKHNLKNSVEYLSYE